MGNSVNSNSGRYLEDLVKMDYVYIVEKDGPYYHGVYGVFSTLELAEAHAYVCSNAETDGSHIFIVSRLILNKKAISIGSDGNIYGDFGIVICYFIRNKSALSIPDH